MDVIQTIETNVTTFLANAEKVVVQDWDAFIGGLTHVAAEAERLKNWVVKADPAIQQQVQTLLQIGEQAGATIVAKGNPMIAGLISAGVDSAEQGAAELIRQAAGNSPGAVQATAIVTGGLSNLGQITTSMATLGYTRAVAGMIAAAQAGVQQGDGQSGAATPASPTPPAA